MNDIITVKNLVKEFEIYHKIPGVMGSLKGLFKRKTTQFRAVDDISFKLKEGELVGFLGKNGAGKTTTLKMLSGLLYPTSGEIKVLGYNPHERKEEFLKKIGFIMGQKSQLWWDIPAIDSFTLIKDIYDVPEKVYKNTLEELVSLMEIEDILHQQVRKLSLGQRMKCELVAALLYQPKVLFLDEPTIGLDIVMQKKIRQFIKEYNKKHNATVILTSHYMDDVKETCDRIIMIDKGSVVWDGQIETMVQKYANFKTIIAVLNTKVSKTELEKFGKVTVFDYPKVEIQVPRAVASKRAGELLNTYDVEDVTILEPELEDIVREFFEKK